MLENIMDDVLKKDKLIDGVYYIVNHKSGMYMDVLNKATSDRSPVGQCEKTACDNQKFKLTDKGNGEWEISSVFAKGKAVDIENSSSANGARVIIYSINNTNAQRFKIEKGESGCYSILTKTSNFKNAIGTKDGSVDAGVALIQLSANDESAVWEFVKI